MDLNEIKNQRVAILGAGREGLAAARFLRTLYAEIELTLVAEFKPEPGIHDLLHSKDRLVVCPLSDARLEAFDLLIRSPGISPYRPAVQHALKAGVEITSPSNLWFASHPDAKTICITGTKGKSTTSAMIAHVLRACGLRVRLAGNIGLPLLDCDDENVDWWVIELSSYQLADLEAKPTIGVLLNLSPEHLDWHGGEAAYRRDKLRLAQLCRDSIVVPNSADPAFTQALSGFENVRWFNNLAGIHVSGSRLFDGRRELLSDLPSGLPGQHNLSNAAATLTVMAVAGVDLDRAAASMRTFRGLPHRLQRVGDRAGRLFVNDSISSTPLATDAALSAFSDQRITLIVGGLDRGLDWSPYMDSFRRRTPAAVIALPDNGGRIIDTMRAAGVEPENGLHLVADLTEAIELAQRLTARGGLVLLSPGAPSFPRFRDYRDRGRQFTEGCGFELDEWDIFQNNQYSGS